jgi:signal transduction histidine kinase
MPDKPQIASERLHVDFAIAHALRAPLQTISGFSEALLEDYGDRLDEKGIDFVTRIRRAGQHLGQVLEGLLLLSRVDQASVCPEWLSLSDLAAQAAETLRHHAPQHRVEFVSAPDVDYSGDRYLMSIVLEQLLSNAWKFTKHRQGARVEFGENADRATFFVRDNGVGFDMAQAETLFAPMQRLHNTSDFGGVGLGLTIVGRAMGRQGGKVWLDSEKGCGTTVYLSLPRLTN